MEDAVFVHLLCVDESATLESQERFVWPTATARALVRHEHISRSHEPILAHQLAHDIHDRTLTVGATPVWDDHHVFFRVTKEHVTNHAPKERHEFLVTTEHVIERLFPQRALRIGVILNLAKARDVHLSHGWHHLARLEVDHGIGAREEVFARVKLVAHARDRRLVREQLHHVVDHLFRLACLRELLLFSVTCFID